MAPRDKHWPHERLREILSKICEMPRFDDRVTDIRKPIPIMAEALANEITSAQVEDARADGNLRSGYRAAIVAASEMTICGVPTGRFWWAPPVMDISRMSVSGSRVSAIRSTVV